MADVATVEEAIQDFAPGASVRSLDRVGGGSINQAAIARTTEGDFFVKWNRHPVPDQFEREAEGLAALAAADSGLVIPRPLAHRRANGSAPALLVLELVEPGAPAPDYDEQMGRGLAALHATKSLDGEPARFGFAHDNYCGATPQPNPWEDEWVPFYREHRIGHMVELAARDRGWSSGDRKALDRLMDRLDELLVEGEPALIHGDLWAGNAHAGPNGEASIIDPAAYFAHREAELGMMTLFGGFGRRVWDAYDEAFPLQDGWRERLPLYELYHALNHYVLFGGGYGSRAASIAKRYT